MDSINKTAKQPGVSAAFDLPANQKEPQGQIQTLDLLNNRHQGVGMKRLSQSPKFDDTAS